jgi:NADPH-dependent 2,4-dienoyl-CoA reductase/sulfur reductase-like enzyme
VTGWRCELTPEPLETEVLVVGAGPAGLAASAHAAEAGARVLLIDGALRPGGQVWRHRGSPPPAARRWIERVIRSGVRLLPSTTIIDAPEPGLLLAERDGQGQAVRYARLVLATGARERFLPFPGWTRPGVMGVGGAQALLKQGARFGGLRVVVAGTGPLLPAVASLLRADGARLAGIVEQASFARMLGFGRAILGHAGKALQGLGYGFRLVGVPFHTGSWVRSVDAATPSAGLDIHLTDGRRRWTWACDVLACGYGLVPNVELPRMLGCELDGERLRLDETLATTVPDVWAAGELGGIGGEGHALVSGAVAGLAAAGRSAPPRLRRSLARQRAFLRRYATTFTLREELRELAVPDTVVCRCEDVSLGRIEPCRSAREAKLRTRAGMGPCQARVCGPALRFLRGWGPDSVRPPLEPVPLSVLEEPS